MASDSAHHQVLSNMLPHQVFREQSLQSKKKNNNNIQNIFTFYDLQAATMMSSIQPEMNSLQER